MLKVESKYSFNVKESFLEFPTVTCSFNLFEVEAKFQVLTLTECKERRGWRLPLLAVRIHLLGLKVNGF